MIIFFHTQCFDGATSAALAIRLLKELGEDRVPALVPVDYQNREAWKQQPLPERSCVVDFLYHPAATYWWDHHVNPFASNDWRQHYEARRSEMMFWQPDSPSCARLLYNIIEPRSHSLPAFLSETVEWADRIDSVQFKTIEEAIQPDLPARQLALSLSVDSSREYQGNVVLSLTHAPLEHIVTMDRHRKVCREAVRRFEGGIELMKDVCTLDGNVAAYDVDPGLMIVDRLMAYCQFPDADYALGILRGNDRTKITCNANPWRGRSAVDLGRLFSDLGGGGHHDVGSIVVSSRATSQINNIKKTVLAAVTKDA
jgi:hypothetical protein